MKNELALKLNSELLVRMRMETFSASGIERTYPVFFVSLCDDFLSVELRSSDNTGKKLLVNYLDNNDNPDLVLNTRNVSYFFDGKERICPVFFVHIGAVEITLRPSDLTGRNVLVNYYRKLDLPF